jgi:hypothetical protein
MLEGGIEMIKRIAELMMRLDERPTYEAYEEFVEELADMIPAEIWDEVDSTHGSPNCTICNDSGEIAVPIVEMNEGDATELGGYLKEDCACVMEYEAQLDEQYQAHLAEKSAEGNLMEAESEVDVEKVD